MFYCAIIPRVSNKIHHQAAKHLSSVALRYSEISYINNQYACDCTKTSRTIVYFHYYAIIRYRSVAVSQNILTYIIL